MDKNIRVKGEGWSIRAIAIGVPSYDVSISLKLARRLSQQEVPAEEKKFRDMIKEWFDESRLNPEHFILSVTTPSGYKYSKGEQSMIFLADISVCTRKQIQKGADSFQEVFMEEVQRLVDALRSEQD